VGEFFGAWLVWVWFLGRGGVVFVRWVFRGGF